VGFCTRCDHLCKRQANAAQPGSQHSAPAVRALVTAISVLSIPQSAACSLDLSCRGSYKKARVHGIALH
jgi:hypothetical protein